MATDIVRATGPLGEVVADHMRAADRAEVWAVRRLPPRVAVACSLAAEGEHWCFVADGVPLAVFGCGPVSGVPGMAAPWLLGAEGVERHGRSFLRLGRAYVGRWVQQYGRLMNAVDARNELSLGWLHRLGFTFHDAVPLGPDQCLFFPFEMRRSDV